MPRVSGGIAFEPVEVEETRDRELTLGPAALIGMALGLCALCALCFAWGFSVGHRSPARALAVQAQSDAPLPALDPGAHAKPAPTAANPPEQGGAADPASTSPQPENTPYASTNPAPAGNAAVVQTALPAEQASAQPAGAQGQVHSALGHGTAWMVQIAAVSHSEDADVLVSALRKRGYAVSAHRDPADDLLHVQVGPFATHDDASAMRQRLLNDGYNAIIEP